MPSLRDKLTEPAPRVAPCMCPAVDVLESHGTCEGEPIHVTDYDAYPHLDVPPKPSGWGEGGIAMLTYEEVQARRAEFEQAVTDARANEVPTTCPISRESCAGRSCACATRVDVGWICGLTSSRKGAHARVVDVDADALLSDTYKLTATRYVKRGYLYA